MKVLNWRALGGAFVCGLAVALLYLGLSKEAVNMPTVIATAVGVFAALFGTTYTILRDAAGRREQEIVPATGFVGIHVE